MPTVWFVNFFVFNEVGRSHGQVNERRRYYTSTFRERETRGPSYVRLRDTDAPTIPDRINTHHRRNDRCIFTRTIVGLNRSIVGRTIR